MANILFNGSAVKTSGTLPEVGSMAPDFTVTKNDLSDLKLSELRGKRVVLNIFPSLDTGVCAQSVRQFNKMASEMDNTVVLCVSADLPFAQSRFCGAEGLDNVIPVSTFREDSFESSYGVMMIDGPLKGLLSRAVVVLDENGNVLHTEQVDDITHEPNYDAAKAVL